MKVILATTNRGKAREVEALLEGSGLQVLTVPMWLGSEETGTTYLENACLKAAAALRLTGSPVLVEDAGLEVEGLGGLPGPRSARFAGPGASDDDNNRKLVRLLTGRPEQDRQARYRAVALLMTTSGAAVMGEGSVEGRIVLEPRGDGGFGYDPLFVPAGEERTAAELTVDEKNRISHRARALEALLEAARAEGLLHARS